MPNAMNVNASIIWLYIFTITVSTSQYFVSTLGASASTVDANETQTKIHKISTITTTSTIVSETCNDRFCYSRINDTATNFKEFAPSFKEYDRLKSTSILYGVAQIATQWPQQTKCSRELNQIYNGIHRKEIWAIKGMNKFP